MELEYNLSLEEILDKYTPTKLYEINVYPQIFGGEYTYRMKILSNNFTTTLYIDPRVISTKINDVIYTGSTAVLMFFQYIADLNPQDIFSWPKISDNKVPSLRINKPDSYFSILTGVQSYSSTNLGPEIVKEGEIGVTFNLTTISINQQLIRALYDTANAPLNPEEELARREGKKINPNKKADILPKISGTYPPNK